MAADIRHFLNNGFDADIIVEAINKAARKPNPGWNYALGIIRNCQDRNITTFQQFKADTQNFERQKDRSNGSSMNNQDGLGILAQVYKEFEDEEKGMVS